MLTLETRNLGYKKNIPYFFGNGYEKISIDLRRQSREHLRYLLLIIDNPMHAKVILTISQGQLQGETYQFDSRTTCLIGRAQDCYPKIPDRQSNRTISRYHCLLDINPPAIRVRDFGSKNGTFINGAKIGQRQPHQTPQEGAKLNFPEYDLADGDEIKLGHTVFRVTIEGAKPANLVSDLDGELEDQPSSFKFHTGAIDPKNVKLREIVAQLLSQAVAVTADSPLMAIRGYSIQSILGKGRCGEVYLVRRDRTGEKSALKIALPQVTVNEAAQDWFFGEVRKTKLLRHPNIVRLKDFGYINGIFFFIQEYCNDGNVLDLMAKRGGKLSVDEAVPIILQILEGLDYAHNAGVVHRDLKPGNIFLSNVGGLCIAKVGDYGLDKSFDLAGFRGQSFTGTKGSMPFFMPRKQVIDFKYAQPDVDVWAAAASLYYMITGTYPRNFTKKDPFLAVLTTEPVAIAKRYPAIPKLLAETIDLALVDNPDTQFKTAVDLKNALLKMHR